LANVHTVFHTLLMTNVTLCTLTFSHLNILPDISQHGLPIIYCDVFLQFTHDQLNNCLDLIERGPLVRRFHKYDIVQSGDVPNYTTRVIRLTHGCLLKQDDWMDWQTSEYLQLNQYADHGCFSAPTPVDKDNVVFHLVWTYNIKTLDGCKKARCVCDGSSQSGLVKIINKVYANFVDQTSSRLFYAVSAAKNLLIFGSDVCNLFAKAPPPKQGFFIRPDRTFNKWWENHMNKSPIPPGHVIPVLSVMQGHPEPPRLWEKHAAAILRELGLTPTTHKPCLYSGVINGKRVVFMHQVDDFANAATNQQTANILSTCLTRN
jgi:hypothetical protein